MTDAAHPKEKPTPPRPPVAVKGTGDGLRITVSSGDPAQIEASLRQHLERRSGTFFEGASVVLEMPDGALDLELAARLGAVLEGAHVQLSAIRAGPETKSPELRGSEPAAAQVPPSVALLVSGTLRSGQRIIHDGPVVVLGDINPGSEIVAGGSVIVWGRLRGTVEAGLSGQEEAVVCALDLAPTQLRIGSALARAPEEPNRRPVPEIARAEGGRIVVDAWQGQEGPP